MPPKKSTNSIIILKFKHKKITYTIPITSTITFEQLKQQLIEAINNSGGIQQEESPPQDIDELDEENIPVPKSELIEQEIEEGALIIVDQLRIAVPRDMSAPYDNQWLELDPSTFSKIKFKDYNILAFAIDEEPFEIEEATYEEEE